MLKILPIVPSRISQQKKLSLFILLFLYLAYYSIIILIHSFQDSAISSFARIN